MRLANLADGLYASASALFTFTTLRRMYEPYAYSLSEHFLIALPQWLPREARHDNWLFAPGHTAGQFAVSDPFQGHGSQHDS